MSYTETQRTEFPCGELIPGTIKTEIWWSSHWVMLCMCMCVCALSTVVRTSWRRYSPPIQSSTSQPPSSSAPTQSLRSTLRHPVEALTASPVVVAEADWAAVPQNPVWPAGRRTRVNSWGATACLLPRRCIWQEVGSHGTDNVTALWKPHCLYVCWAFVCFPWETST